MHLLGDGAGTDPRDGGTNGGLEVQIFLCTSTTTAFTL